MIDGDAVEVVEVDDDDDDDADRVKSLLTNKRVVVAVVVDVVLGKSIVPTANAFVNKTIG